MSQNTADGYAKQFGLEAISDGVLRLTELLANQGASTEDIARIIKADKELTARVLKAANPRAEDEFDYTITTVDDALMRSGVGGALLIAMTGPLVRAITKTFDTMLSMKVENVSARSLSPYKEEHVTAEVSFSGKAVGAVQIRLTLDAAREFAAAMLGLQPDEIGDENEVNDVLGEMANIVVGNFKSNLCDAGLPCKLSPPQIAHTEDFKLRTQEDGLAERLGFKTGDTEFFVDIAVNPWS
jgi:chemotaxis protein CheX